jgi:hypothetical protein
MLLIYFDLKANDKIIRGYYVVLKHRLIIFCSGNGALSTFFHGFPYSFIVGDIAVLLQFKIYHPACVQVITGER